MMIMAMMTIINAQGYQMSGFPRTRNRFVRVFGTTTRHHTSKTAKTGTVNFVAEHVGIVT